MEEQQNVELNTMSVMEELASLRNNAEHGGPLAVCRLRSFLDEHPDIWQVIGDLSAHVRESLLEIGGGNDVTATESIRRKMQQLQAELVGESQSPTVRLLAEQCVICWAQLSLAELARINQELSGKAPGYEVQKRLNAIQGRYVQALKTLATVQQLIKPTAVPAKPALKLIS